MGILDRFLGLIRHGIGEGEEARTAAQQACRMIDNGRVVILGSDDPRTFQMGSEKWHEALKAEGWVALRADDLRLATPGTPGWKEGPWGAWLLEQAKHMAREEVRQQLPHIEDRLRDTIKLPIRPSDPGWASSEAGRWAIAEAARLCKDTIDAWRKKRPKGHLVDYVEAELGLNTRPAPPPLVPRPVDPSAWEPTWVRFERSKFDGFCKICRNPIAMGTPIYWKRGEGSRHAPCHEAAK
jgi:hypothetical protein